MKDHRIKGIIFDYGGTLDNNGDHWAVTIRKAFGAILPFDVPLDSFCQAYISAEREMDCTHLVMPRHTFREMMEIKATLELKALVAEGFEIESEAIQKYAASIASYTDVHARACVDMARPVLEYLVTRYPMALVSNFYGNINTVLRDYGIGSFFSAVIESSVTGIRKPDPAIFRIGTEALGIEPADVLVVGDSISKDIFPARSIGCQTIWISGKQWFYDKPGIEVEPKIESITELSKLY